MKKITTRSPMMIIGLVKEWFKSQSRFKKALVIFAGISILFVVYIASLLVRYKYLPINDKTNIAEQSQREKDTPTSTQKSGVMCAGIGNYSFQMDTASAPIAESDKALILQSKSGLLLISKGEVKIEEILKKQNIPFEKVGNTYVFSLSSTLSSDISADSQASVMSVKKGEYTISLLYSPTDKLKAEKTFQAVVASIKGGCSNE